jgi:hypothetical protein
MTGEQRQLVGFRYMETLPLSYTAPSGRKGSDS